ncbi:MAG: hypothetical protein ACRD8W_32855 [Nitrososphaeraceae archaeon]
METTSTYTTAAFLTCILLLVALGAAIVVEESNHIAQAQLEQEEEEEKTEKPKQSDQSAAAAAPNGLSVKLDRAHFIPLTPLSDSPGNQVKMLLAYNVEESSPFVDGKVNAVMEIYSAANQTLLRTSSLPQPIVLEDSEGTIQLATTFNDANLRDVTARALLTDAEKVNPISDPLEAAIGLGEVRTATSDSK